MGSLLAAALARAQDYLLEPAPRAGPPPSSAVEGPPAPPAVQVAVTGLSRGAGASTLAAGLALALLVPGARPAHLVSIGATGERGRARLGPLVRWELPPALRGAGELAGYGATLARLAGAHDGAAIVWDVPCDEMPRAAGLVDACDALVCVAHGSAEPVLSSVVRDMLGERHGRVVLAANRVRDPDAWSGRCAAAVPESRLAAALLARGRAPGGGVGEALARLAAAAEGRA
jgi:hypothetical protein